MKRRFFSVLYMFLITLVFTSMVSAVKEITQDKVERNEKLKLEKVILKVLGLVPAQTMGDQEVISLFETRIRELDVDAVPVYVGYKKDAKTIIGYAFPVGGPGFWGPISGIVAVDSTATKVLGIAFHRHSETPGLGARITEDWFTNQFKGLKIFPVEGGKKIFYLRPQGSGKAPNELDAITGATNTSRALENFLNRDLRSFLDRLWKGIRPGQKGARAVSRPDPKRT